MLYTLHTVLPHPYNEPGGPPHAKALGQHQSSVSSALEEENPGLHNLAPVLIPALE